MRRVIRLGLVGVVLSFALGACSDGSEAGSGAAGTSSSTGGSAGASGSSVASGTSATSSGAGGTLGAGGQTSTGGSGGVASDASVSGDGPSTADAPSSDATHLDGPVSGGDASDAATCSTPVANDPLAARRATCEFGTGAKATDTLPITGAARAALPIKHVIVLMKENRSFDHMLGQLNASGQPAVEAIPAGFSNKDNANVNVPSYHLDTSCINKDPGHQWDEMHAQVDNGAMDGFVKSAANTTGTDGHFAMGTYGPQDLPFYYWLANTYAINDRHFASVRSGTFPDRNFLLLGTADGVKCTGCGYPNPSTKTIFDEFDTAGVTWGVYSDGSLLSGTLNWPSSHKGAHPFADFLQALKAGTLPQVSFVDGIDNVEDEHPTGDVQVGEAWTRNIYETAVASPLWPGLAILWTYDEAGGFADHVPPPNKACVARPGVSTDDQFFELGVRVPMAVISPYARKHYVSHVVQEHTAITRFIEVVFDLPALTHRDANSDALLDMFDFGCEPALLHPPTAPAQGLGGCHGMVVLTTDKPNYTSSDAMQIMVSFKGLQNPRANDWIGVYHYGDVPSEANQLRSVAWVYIGGTQTPGAAPTMGTVTIAKSSANGGAPWPLAPGGWIAYYLPALPGGGDGHTPVASVDFNVVQ
jgi:phospholipase C